VTLSRIFPSCCKYTPTCSDYFIEALKKKGFFKGFFMGVWRILRCNPFSKGGYDPVE
jgi:putative membrane protein insertion efficiency factor